jgi:hypothetical protein
VRLALRRALGGLGGAIGALPSLPIARGLAERWVGPATLPGAERLAGDVKAATWAELAVFVFLVPTSAFLFGRLLPDVIRRRGGFCVALPGIAMGGAFLLWRSGAEGAVGAEVSLLAGLAAAAGVMALSILGPRLLGLSVVPRPPEVPKPANGEDESVGRVRGWVVGIVLVVIFAAAVRIVGPMRGAIELFEEGQILTPMGVYLAGGAPYRDTYPVHGWGTDGGVDALAAKLFGPTFEVMRSRRALWAALGVPALALACWALFRRPLWSLGAFGLALSLCPYPSERQMPAFAGLAALVWAARSGRRRAWVAAGVVSCAAVFYSLEYGVFLVTAGALTTLTLGLFERRWKIVVKTAAAFLAGAALAAVPFLWRLAQHDAVKPFLRASFRELPRTISDVWGLPAVSAVPIARDGGVRTLARALLFGEALPWALHAAVLALAVTVLLWRSAVPGLSRTDRAAVGATWFAILAMRGALGRADYGHLVMHGVFVALPAAWLVFRAGRAPHWRWLLAPALGLVLLVAARPGRAAAVAWSGIRRSSAPSECLRPMAGGRAILPCWQAGEFETLRASMDAALGPSETFFDFGNEPGLYFLLERRPPVRFPCAPCSEGEAAEREVIAALERVKPPVAILASGSWRDVIDGVPTRERAPLIAEYLDRHYEPAGKLGPRTFARRRDAP